MTTHKNPERTCVQNKIKEKKTNIKLFALYSQFSTKTHIKNTKCGPSDIRSGKNTKWSMSGARKAGSSGKFISFSYLL